MTSCPPKPCVRSTTCSTTQATSQARGDFSPRPGQKRSRSEAIRRPAQSSYQVCDDRLPLRRATWRTRRTSATARRTASGPPPVTHPDAVPDLVATAAAHRFAPGWTAGAIVGALANHPPANGRRQATFMRIRLCVSCGCRALTSPATWLLGRQEAEPHQSATQLPKCGFQPLRSSSLSAGTSWACAKQRGA